MKRRLPVALPILLVGLWLVGIVSILGISTAWAESVEVGYRDFSFGSPGNFRPTGEKPESKLWWNDGSWWGSLRNDDSSEYMIYRLDLLSHTWVNTGVILDDRGTSKADTLWDSAGQKLYVASHIFAQPGAPSPDPMQWSRLYRYSYDPIAKTYSLDAGFPVIVAQSVSETLTVAKDSTGTVWISYVEGNMVMVNHSQSSDLDWGLPYALPFADAVNLRADDISAIIAFQGDKIGVMWSNQSDDKMHFAIHIDSDDYNAWQAEETAIPGPVCNESCADDHINLKAITVDNSGRVFAAIKTSLAQPNAPAGMLLVRDLNGSWSDYVFSRVRDGLSKPMVLLDEEHNRIYMFAELSGVIYYKSADLDNIQFVSGLGDPFISSSLDLATNNPTSTKQNLNDATGLVVLASDSVTKYYLHNYIDLSVPRPVINTWLPLVISDENAP